MSKKSRDGSFLFIFKKQQPSYSCHETLNQNPWKILFFFYNKCDKCYRIEYRWVSEKYFHLFSYDVARTFIIAYITPLYIRSGGRIETKIFSPTVQPKMPINTREQFHTMEMC